MDELWAEKAVAKFNKSKPGKLYSLDEVKKKLEQNVPQQAKKKSKAILEKPQRK